MLVKKKVKYIQTLGQKKFREQEGLFIAEGPKVVEELLAESADSIREVYALKSWIEEHPQLSKKAGAIEISEIELEKISQLATPNKVIAVVEQFKPALPIQVKGKITIVLDTLQDPGNLGTIIRTADWFGITQIVCSVETADVYNPKVVQSTMGSIARVRVFYTDLEEWLTAHREVLIYATSPAGKDINTIEKINEGIIIIGNESKGISEHIFRLADKRISISRKGKAESLNAAVATGIILSHLMG